MAARRLEGKQKLREHPLGMMTHVESVLELAEALRQVLTTDMDMRAPDAVLEEKILMKIIQLFTIRFKKILQVLKLKRFNTFIVN